MSSTRIRNTPSVPVQFGAKWLPLANDPAPRCGCGVAVLNEKQVIFIGGFEKNGRSNEVTMVNLETEKYTKLAKLNRRKSHCTAIVVHQLLFVFGGYANGEWLRDVEVLDLNEDSTKNDTFNQKFQLLKDSHSLPKRWSRATLVANDEFIYLIGGYSDGFKVLDSVYRIHIQSKEWTILPSMNKRRAFAMAVILNGFLVVLGGHNKDDGFLSSVETFPLDGSQTTSWTFANKRDFLPQPRACGMAFVVGNGEIVVAGSEGSDGNWSKTFCHHENGSALVNSTTSSSSQGFTTHAFPPFPDSWSVWTTVSMGVTPRCLVFVNYERGAYKLPFESSNEKIIMAHSFGGQSPEAIQQQQEKRDDRLAFELQQQKLLKQQGAKQNDDKEEQTRPQQEEAGPIEFASEWHQLPDPPTPRSFKPKRPIQVHHFGNKSPEAIKQQERNDTLFPWLTQEHQEDQGGQANMKQAAAIGGDPVATHAGVVGADIDPTRAFVSVEEYNALLSHVETHVTSSSELVAAFASVDVVQLGPCLELIGQHSMDVSKMIEDSLNEQGNQREITAILSTPRLRDFYLAMMQLLKATYNTMDSIASNLIEGSLGTRKTLLDMVQSREKKGGIKSKLSDLPLLKLSGVAVAAGIKQLEAVPAANLIGSTVGFLFSLKDSYEGAMAATRVSLFGVLCDTMFRRGGGTDRALELISRLTVRCYHHHGLIPEMDEKFKSRKRRILRLAGAKNRNTPVKEAGAIAAQQVVEYISNPSAAKESSMLNKLYKGEEDTDNPLSSALSIPVIVVAEVFELSVGAVKELPVIERSTAGGDDVGTAARVDPSIHQQQRRATTTAGGNKRKVFRLNRRPIMKNIVKSVDGPKQDVSGQQAVRVGDGDDALKADARTGTGSVHRLKEASSFDDATKRKTHGHDDDEKEAGRSGRSGSTQKPHEAGSASFATQPLTTETTAEKKKDAVQKEQSRGDGVPTKPAVVAPTADTMINSKNVQPSQSFTTANMMTGNVDAAFLYDQLARRVKELKEDADRRAKESELARIQEKEEADRRVQALVEQHRAEIEALRRVTEAQQSELEQMKAEAQKVEDVKQQAADDNERHQTELEELRDTTRALGEKLELMKRNLEMVKEVRRQAAEAKRRARELEERHKIELEHMRQATQTQDSELQQVKSDLKELEEAKKQAADAGQHARELEERYKSEICELREATKAQELEVEQIKSGVQQVEHAKRQAAEAERLARKLEEGHEKLRRATRAQGSELQRVKADVKKVTKKINPTGGGGVGDGLARAFMDPSVAVSGLAARIGTIELKQDGTEEQLKAIGRTATVLTEEVAALNELEPAVASFVPTQTEDKQTEQPKKWRLFGRSKNKKR